MTGAVGERPARVESPSSAAEAGALLRRAGEEGRRVLPRGRGDGPAGGADLVIASSGLGGSPDHEPADLTVTAGAGVTLGELDTVVRREGQWLPLDPPASGAATLGEVVARGIGGPLSFAFGRPRDHVLGLTLVDGEGRVLELGGRVVKNVAGFDLVRLVGGSRGALGMITSVSLRLFPVPEADRTVIREADGIDEGWALARRLATLPLPLGAVELEIGEGVRVGVRALGSSAAVRRMERDAAAEGGSPDRVLEGEAAAEFWGRLDARGEAGGEGDEFRLRARTLPDRGGEAATAATALGAALREEGATRVRIALRAGTGELRLNAWGMGGRSGAAGGNGAVANELRRFREALAAMGGSVRVVRLPGADPDGARLFARELSTPPAPGVARLRSRLRKAFDPRGILPGAWREGW